MFKDAAIIELIKDLSERLTAIEALLATEITWKTVAEDRATELKDLRDRFMARDFHSYASMREVEGANVEVLKPPKEDPRTDDDYAGEIIDGRQTE